MIWITVKWILGNSSAFYIVEQLKLKEIEMKNKKFETFIQKRGRGVRFPLSQIEACGYVRGQLPEYIEKMLLKPYHKGDLVITSNYSGINIREKESFLKDYQSIKNQESCEHSFKVITASQSRLNGKWKECVHCLKVDRGESLTSESSSTIPFSGKDEGENKDHKAVFLDNAA